MSKLDDWKQSPRRKPLILNGARQVGKTWLLKEFGATRFENVAYVNFDGNLAMASVFEAGYDIPRLLTNIQAGTGTRIVEGGDPRHSGRGAGMPEGTHVPEVLLRGRARPSCGGGGVASWAHGSPGHGISRGEGEHA